LHCVNAADGTVVWKKNTNVEWPSEKGFFGRACSPIIAGGVLILQIGGEGGAGIVGLDPVTGDLKWKATNHEAGYASPVALGGNVACFTREGFVLLEPKSGRVLLEKKHRAGMNASVNAASPVVVGEDRVFLSACYDVGAVLWNVGEQVDEIWANAGNLDCHFGTPVLVKERLYGFHGRQEQGVEFRCVNVGDGAVKWASPTIGTGHVISVGEVLVALTEKGELILHPVGGDAFTPSVRAQVLSAGVRAAPAFARGCLFARDKKNLVCVSLGK
jgi:outer membrane protein assembly factor BamB